MELLTTSILTLLALYVIYSEPFKLPTIVKKNKNLFYILIIGLYLYYLQNNNVGGSVDGFGPEDNWNIASLSGPTLLLLFCCCFWCCEASWNS